VLLGLLVEGLAFEDLLLALGLSDVLDADMDALLDDSAIDELVDTHSDGGLGDVEDDSRAAVVTLVWHTSVDAWIGEDVDVVTDLDLHQVLGKVHWSMLPEFLGKHVPGAGSRSE